MSKIVIGLGYGDEGKGLTTAFLCKQYEKIIGNPMVVRANGGHQAGHTVIHEDKRHIFSNFGSGTLQGIPTYWSEYCTFSPIGVLNERNALNKLGITPKLYVHPLCPITTPYDRKFNCQMEKSTPNGSCGVGFGATIQRQEDYYKLFVQDLFHEKVLFQKLWAIRGYYSSRGVDVLNVELGDFLKVIDEVKKIIIVDNGADLLWKYNLVFEGAQGVLLDQDFGFFPNVTRSNTTSKNALKIIDEYDVFRKQMYDYDKEPEIFYITRAYQTRHGNGFMTNENISAELKLTNTENETNVTNEYQGHFRKSVLDIDLLNYALQCDSNFSTGIKKNLVITCVDQTGETIAATMSNGDNTILHNIPVSEIPKHLNCDFKNVYVSRGASISDISLLK